MPLIVRKKVREWNRLLYLITSQQVLLSDRRYSEEEKGFVKQISLLENFLVLLMGASNVYYESLIHRKYI
jgi:ABC-type cobalamin transport system permease subunit